MQMEPTHTRSPTAHTNGDMHMCAHHHSAPWFQKAQGLVGLHLGVWGPRFRWKIPQKVIENTKAKIQCDFQIQTDKQVFNNQPDIINKDQKIAVMIDITVPNDSNIRKKEYEKLDKYQGLKEKLERM